jgi:hypothetical protein
MISIKQYLIPLQQRKQIAILKRVRNALMFLLENKILIVCNNRKYSFYMSVIREYVDTEALVTSAF